MSEEPQNVSDLYSRHQQLFNDRFAEIMIRTFVGFERSKFDALEQNDPEESAPSIEYTIRWYEDDDRYNDPDAELEDWEEGDISYFSDGLPALDPTDEEF